MVKRGRAAARRATAPATTARRSWRASLSQPWTIALVLAAAACALYAPSWRHGFVGDDAMVITKNAWTIEGWSALPRVLTHSLYFGAVPLNGGLYRPVAGAYYLIVGQLVDLTPTGFHLAQMLLYGLNAATVFLFLMRVWRRAVAPAAVAALLFLAHPIHTEVVNNIKSADELLCLQFLLVSLWAWLRYADAAPGKTNGATDATTRWWLLAVASYALAVGSKETAVPMVVTFPALWWWFRARTLTESARASWPFALVTTLYLLARHAVLSAEPATSIVTVLNNALLSTADASVRLASAIAYLGRYVRMLVWPWPLSFDYSYNAIALHHAGDAAVWGSLALLAALLAVFVAGLKQRRAESFAVLWFFASMAAVSNVVVLISTNFGERLLYLPSVAACAVIAVVIFHVAHAALETPLADLRRMQAVVVPVAILAVLGGLLTLRRTRDWKDELTLFRADVKTFPNSARLNNYVGSLLYFEAERLMGDPDLKEVTTAEFRRAKEHLTRGLSILPTFQEIHTALGMADYRLGQCDIALPELQQAMAFPNERTTALEMIGDCHGRMGHPEQALAIYRQLDKEGATYPEGLFALGNDAALRGDIDGSIVYFSKFIAADPSNVAARFNIASAYHLKGDFVHAIAEADQCAALNPTPQVGAKCLLLAADALSQTGHQDEAMAHFNRAKALDPTNPWIRK